MDTKKYEALSLKEGLALALAIGHRERIAAVNQYLGKLYLLKKQINRADPCFESILAIARDLGHKRLILILLVQSWSSILSIKSPEENLKNRLSMAREIELNWYIRDIQRKLASLYIKKQDFPLADSDTVGESKNE